MTLHAATSPTARRPAPHRSEIDLMHDDHNPAPDAQPDAGLLPLFDVITRAEPTRSDVLLDSSWFADGLDAIARAASTGRTFGAYDLVTDYGLREPDAPCRWGLLFARARRAGLIEPVGAAPSRRRTVHRSLAMVWRAASGWTPPSAEDAA